MCRRPAGLTLNCAFHHTLVRYAVAAWKANHRNPYQYGRVGLKWRALGLKRSIACKSILQ